MKKHTPGPWSVFRTPSGYDHIRGPKNQRISHECSDLDDLGEEAKANARLIAAAPDLLEALKDAASFCPCSVDERLSGHRSECRAPDWWELIHKAEGE